MSTSTRPAANAATVIVAAALMLAVTSGTRSSWGLFIGPINSSSGFGAATISLAIAVAALAWGAAQPLAGLLVVRIGVVRLMLAGGVLVAATTAAVPLAGSGWQFGLVMAVAGAAAAAGSAPLLMGIVAQRVTAERRGFALGALAAGGSVGQLIFTPAIALMIASFGWSATMFALAATALLVSPLALVFGGAPARHDVPAAAPAPSPRAALKTSDYWLVTAGFFVCGFHVTLLTTHMPGVIDLCGFPAGFSGIWLALVGACNIIGSIGIGFAMRRWQMKSLLATAYALRALGVALFLAVPANTVTLSIFALWMGLTFMVTLPLTSGLIAHLFGARNLATLFGITMAAHQVGSFLGASLGGLELELTGGYHWIWLLDIALAVAAAIVHFPVREKQNALGWSQALAASAR